ncbi:LysE family transporter [Streptomyces sp. NBC_00356]|uniref:LysE family transporter n=1 Tax=Streptomyces sp. NBC_00356 TaxID=2975724 RepID=UPI002E274F1F
MFDSAVAGALAGYGLSIPVGAVAVLMINLTARTSFRVGAAAAIGATTADALYAVTAVAGGAAVATVIQPFSEPLRWIAFLVLAVMAARIAVAGLRGQKGGAVQAPTEEAAITPRRSFMTFLALTALNPWPALYFVALILGHPGLQNASWVEAVVYIVAVVAASASWQLLLAGGGAVFGRFITGPRGRKATAVVSSALIFGLGAHMALG